MGNPRQMGMWMGKRSINDGLSIAMFDYQRVFVMNMVVNNSDYHEWPLPLVTKLVTVGDHWIYIYIHVHIYI